MIGFHEVTISDTGVFEKSDVGESTISWKGIERIAATPEHLFLFVNSLSGHAIPKGAFKSEEEFLLFCAEAKRLKDSYSA